MKHKQLQKSALYLAVLASISSFPLQALQQATPDTRAEKEIEVITVTSRKREETLIEVPMNVSSVSALEITDRNLLTIDDLHRTLAGAASPTGTLILRGLSGGNGSAPETTSSFTDDIPFEFGDLYDVEAVEVLRGPQGTLWGSNAIGGTTRVITKKPQLNNFEFSSALQAKETGSVDGTDLQAWSAVNLPLIDDTLALRVTAHSSSKPGAIINANTGIQRKDEDKYIRSQLLWKVSDDTRLNFGYYSLLDNSVGARYADLSRPTSRQYANTVANPDSPYGFDVDFASTKCATGQSRAACFGNRSAEGVTKYHIWESLDNWSKDKTNLFTLSADVDNIADLASFS